MIVKFILPLLTLLIIIQGAHQTETSEKVSIFFNIHSILVILKVIPQYLACFYNLILSLPQKLRV